MKLSAIVPAYNEENSIGRCLDRLLDQTRPFDEIIVVDNASTDKTGEVVAAYAARNPAVRVVFEASPGIVNARRAGFDAATGDVLARTDADTLVSRGWAAAIEAHFAGPRGADHQALTGPHPYGDGPPFDPLRRAAERSVLYREGGDGAVVGLVGPNTIMSARAWREIRGDLVDDSAVAEDADVGRRLLAAGHRIWFDPDVAVEQSPRQLRYSPWQNRSYLMAGVRLARARRDRRMIAMSLVEIPFRFALYTVYWVTYRPWDPDSRTWRPHRLVTRLDRDRALVTDRRAG